jgi:hypothetical protein
MRKILYFESFNRRLKSLAIKSAALTGQKIPLHLQIWWSSSFPDVWPKAWLSFIAETLALPSFP